jgi:hypothetical protein
MNTLTKLAINKKISAIFADGTKKMNLGVSTVVGLLNAPEPRKVPVVVAPNGRSKLLRDLAESSGRNVVQDDQDGTLLVQPESSASPETTSVMDMLDKIEEPPVVKPEAVAWQDMTDEQRVEVIADDDWLVQNGGDPPDWPRCSDSLCTQVASAVRILMEKWRRLIANVEDATTAVQDLIITIDREWPPHTFDRIVEGAASEIGLQGFDCVKYRQHRLDKWRELVSFFESKPKRQ